MNERENRRTSSRETREDSQEASLRRLFATAYPPVKLTPALRQQMADAIDQRSSPVARTRRWTLPRFLPWGATAAAGLAALTAVTLRLVMVRPGSHHPVRQAAPSTARQPQPGRAPMTAEIGPQRPIEAHSQPIARRHVPSPGGERDEAEYLPSPTAPGQAKRHERAPDSVPHDRPRVATAGDLDYLNDAPESTLQRVEWHPDAWDRIEARVYRGVRVRDDFVQIPFPRIAATSDRQIAAAVESYRREAAVVDARLSRAVTLQQKATALSDLCERLRAVTGLQLTAGPSVADEKVTIFCAKRPLREVMRQLSRPFGYTWLRSGKAADYRYELVQDLRSQLLEEELRSRNRNAALLALHREMERYRPYLHLSPDEALAMSRTAPPAEKALLERLAGKNWGPIQMYARLSPADLAALRAGRRLDFMQQEGGDPGPKDTGQALPAEVARGVLQSYRDLRIRDNPAEPYSPQFGTAGSLPDGVPPASYPNAHVWVSLQLGHSELGQYTMDSISGVYAGETTTGAGEMGRDSSRELASGLSPSARNPENARRNSAWSQDPALQGRISLSPQPSRRPAPAAAPAPTSPPEVKVTSADVLEALHHATGLPIVSDYYTRLYPASQVAVRNLTLFDALNRLSDTMRLRWNREKAPGTWLQFRSLSFYEDRLKEVPNRLLSRWSVARRRQGELALDELCEIAQLTDVQLDSNIMAEGARELFDLQEWDLARHTFREHLRYLSTLTPAQRRTAMSAAGLPARQLTRSQQQQLVDHLGDRAPSLEALSQMTIRVEYIHPGEFQWVQPGSSEWGPNRTWPANYFGFPTVRGRTREAVLEAARRIDPAVDPGQIRPTEPWLAIIYRSVEPQTGRRFEIGQSGTAERRRSNW